MTVQNIMSPARTYTAELIGNWKCGQAGVIKGRVHYDSVAKRLEVSLLDVTVCPNLRLNVRMSPPSFDTVCIRL